MINKGKEEDSKDVKDKTDGLDTGPYL